jgi:hypothetical protein
MEYLVGEKDGEIRRIKEETLKDSKRMQDEIE